MTWIQPMLSLSANINCAILAFLGPLPQSVTISDNPAAKNQALSVLIFYTEGKSLASWRAASATTGSA